MQTHKTKFKLAFTHLCCNKKKIIESWRENIIEFAHPTVSYFSAWPYYVFLWDVGNWATTAWCCSISTELLSQHLISAYLNCKVKWVSLNHLTCLSTFGTVQKSVSNQLQKLKFAFLLAADDVTWVASLMQGLSTCSAFMTSHTCLRRGICLDYFSYVSSFVLNPEYGPSMRVEQYCFFWEQPTQTTTIATEQ